MVDMLLYHYSLNFQLHNYYLFSILISQNKKTFGIAINANLVTSDTATASDEKFIDNYDDNYDDDDDDDATHGGVDDMLALEAGT